MQCFRSGCTFDTLEDFGGPCYWIRWFKNRDGEAGDFQQRMVFVDAVQTHCQSWLMKCYLFAWAASKLGEGPENLVTIDPGSITFTVNGDLAVGECGAQPIEKTRSIHINDVGLLRQLISFSPTSVGGIHLCFDVLYTHGEGTLSLLLETVAGLPHLESIFFPTVLLNEDNYELFMEVMAKTQKLVSLDFGLGLLPASIPSWVPRHLHVKRLHLSCHRTYGKHNYKHLQRFWEMSETVVYYDDGHLTYSSIYERDVEDEDFLLPGGRPFVDGATTAQEGLQLRYQTFLDRAF